MSRRGITLVVSGVLLVVLGAVVALLPVPYVMLGPGPTENVLGSYRGVAVIKVDGHDTYPTEGSLELTTVSVTPARVKLPLIEAFLGWLDPAEAVVPRRAVYPDDVTRDEVEKQNTEAMQRSQESAKVAAMRQLGITVPEVVVVDAVVTDGPAKDLLEPGDVVRKVDGVAVTTSDQVRAAIVAHKPGEVVEFEVERANTVKTVRVTTAASTDSGTPRAVVGIFPSPGYDFPFTVDITLGQDIGGPSAGLMFALGILDTLTPGALVGGAHIAGTGTITAAGEVGPIGGIGQKIHGAKESGDTAFLAPAANCAEAKLANVPGIRVVRVATLREAVAAVEAVVAGRTADLPTC